MEEENQSINEEQETEEESTPENTGERVQPKAESLIKQANNAAERIENANKVSEEIQSRKEELEAKRLLGGEAEGGSQPIKTPKLTDQEYAQALTEGKVNPLKEDGYFC